MYTKKELGLVSLKGLNDAIYKYILYYQEEYYIITFRSFKDILRLFFCLLYSTQQYISIRTSDYAIDMTCLCVWLGNHTIVLILFYCRRRWSRGHSFLRRLGGFSGWWGGERFWTSRLGWGWSWLWKFL